jgi:hypothetical protein
MNDLIQGIDVIFKLIPQLKSFTGARRREYFDELLKPLFESFQGVHEFYNELFLATRYKVVDLASDSFSNADGSLTMEQMTILRQLKEDFLKSRARDEFLRDSLRREAQDMFTNVEKPQERRFLASVAYYFLGSEGIAPRDESVDLDVEEIIRRGGITCWNTPSTRIYQAIRDERDLSRLIQLLDESRDSLNQKYMNVRRRFRQVQEEIINKT